MLFRLGPFKRRGSYDAQNSAEKRLIETGVVLVALIAIGATVRRPIKELFLAGDMYDAIEAGDAQTVDNLLQKGANPNREGAGGLMGGTPLFWATEKSDVKVMKVLIAGGATVDQKVGEDGYTALMVATTPQTAQVLINAGANPHLRNASNYSAIDSAKRANLPQVVKVLQTKIRS